MRENKKLRFAARADDGRMSAIWSVIATRSGDFYIARRGFPAVKASLHASGQWQLGCTQEAIKQGKAAESISRFPDQVGRGRTRHADRWVRPPATPEGLTKAFFIRVPERALCHRDPTASRVTWLGAPGKERMLEVAMRADGINTDGDGRSSNDLSGRDRLGRSLSGEAVALSSGNG